MRRYKVYVILGGSGGIGSAVARQLVADGMKVALVARRAEPLEDLAGELGGAMTGTLDATDIAAVEQFVQSAAQSHGGIDGIVNCVGSIPIGSTRLRSQPLVGNEACHGVAKGEAGHPRSRLYRVENFARASQLSEKLGVSPSVSRAQRARPPAEMIGWPYANHPPYSSPFGSGHNRSLRRDRSRSAPPGFVLDPWARTKPVPA